MAKKKAYRSSGLYQYRHAGIIKTFVIVGAIVGIILAVYYMISPAVSYNIFSVKVEILLWVIAWGILHVIICVALLASTGVVKKRKLRFRLDWWVLLIISLVIALPTGNWGGVFVLIAAVIGIFDKL